MVRLLICLISWHSCNLRSFKTVYVWFVILKTTTPSTPLLNIHILKQEQQTHKCSHTNTSSNKTLNTDQAFYSTKLLSPSLYPTCVLITQIKRFISPKLLSTSLYPTDQAFYLPKLHSTLSFSLSNMCVLKIQIKHSIAPSWVLICT